MLKLLGIMALMTVIVLLSLVFGPKEKTDKKS